jgi:hypothetical protein
MEAEIGCNCESFILKKKYSLISTNTNMFFTGILVNIHLFLTRVPHQRILFTGVQMKHIYQSLPLFTREPSFGYIKSTHLFIILRTETITCHTAAGNHIFL